MATLSQAHLLRFTHLHHAGRAYEFPCDKDGQPLLTRMGATMQDNYQHVSDTVGQDFSYPEIVYNPVL